MRCKFRRAEGKIDKHGKKPCGEAQHIAARLCNKEEREEARGEREPQKYFLECFYFYAAWLLILGKTKQKIYGDEDVHHDVAGEKRRVAKSAAGATARIFVQKQIRVNKLKRGERVRKERCPEGCVKNAFPIYIFIQSGKYNAKSDKMKQGDDA